MVEPWYKKGLSFKCTGCGKCCTGTPGYVWITEEEVEEMARFLQITPTQFRCTYTRFVNGKLALLENQKNYDCVFLKDKQCQVYAQRPRQCRTFPWWPQNLKTAESWKSAKKECEGIDHPEAPVVNLEEIEKNLNLHHSRFETEL